MPGPEPDDTETAEYSDESGLVESTGGPGETLQDGEGKASPHWSVPEGKVNPHLSEPDGKANPH